MYKNISSFATTVVETIKAQSDNYFPSNFKVSDVSVQEVIKGNDTKLVGVVIKKGDCNISPNIYLEEFYERYLKGEDIDSIIDDICRIRIENDTPNFNADDLTNLDNVKDKINCRLINKALNAEYLSNKPYREVEDLAVMYVALLGENAGGQMAMPITNSLLNSFGISVAELDKIAMDNLAKSDIEFKSMYDIMKGMISPDMYEMLPPDDGTMYVLTNKSKMNGANAILDKATMEGIREKLGCDFIIIPSSVHEVIIIKVNSNDVTVEDLNGMIGSVNTNELDPKDILSDHPYIYTKKDGFKTL